MNYNDSKNPPGPYKSVDSDPPYFDNGKPRAVSPKKRTPPPPPSPGTKGHFIEKTVKDGVGRYHGNHFIGYFEAKHPLFPLLPSPEQLIAANEFFRKNFYEIFSLQNVAHVMPSAYTLNGDSVIQFQLGGSKKKVLSFASILSKLTGYPSVDFGKLTGLVHSDWVCLKLADDKLSFYGATLKKNWLEKEEFALFKRLAGIATDLGLIDEFEADRIVRDLLEMNMHHFLAGRRSWAVGFDPDLFLWYVETVAFERNSLCEYSVIDKYGPLRQTVIDMWVKLVYNFCLSLETPLVLQITRPLNLLLTDDYVYDGRNVVYKTAEDKSHVALRALPWFAKALSRHPGLTKGLGL